MSNIKEGPNHDDSTVEIQKVPENKIPWDAHYVESITEAISNLHKHRNFVKAHLKLPMGTNEISGIKDKDGLVAAWNIIGAILHPCCTVIHGSLLNAFREKLHKTENLNLQDFIDYEHKELDRLMTKLYPASVRINLAELYELKARPQLTKESDALQQAMLEPVEEPDMRPTDEMTPEEREYQSNRFPNIWGREENEIIFRGRRKDNGQWIYGNYHHNIRKGKFHSISEKDNNIEVHIYRDSLEIRGYGNVYTEV